MHKHALHLGLLGFSGDSSQSSLQAYDSVKDVILRIVDRVLSVSEAESSDEQREGGDRSWLKGVQEKAEEAVGKLDGSDQWHIYTTGHSMGGALATLCAHEFAVRSSPLPLPPQYIYVTFPCMLAFLLLELSFHVVSLGTCGCWLETVTEGFCRPEIMASSRQSPG